MTEPMTAAEAWGGYTILVFGAGIAADRLYLEIKKWRQAYRETQEEASE